ncbi:hypothetical protein PARA125_000114 [Parachlamydia sp. AcF125]|nr:hypothetical protein [Parachlamydia sp. AcF125]
MAFDFINNTIKITASLAFLISFILLPKLAYKDFASLYLGIGWGCLNLFLLKLLFKHVLRTTNKEFLKIGFLLGLKVPLFYLLGYFLLTSSYLVSFYLVLGFSLSFLGIFLLGLGTLLFPKGAV